MNNKVASICPKVYRYELFSLKFKKTNSSNEIHLHFKSTLYIWNDFVRKLSSSNGLVLFKLLTIVRRNLN